MTRNREDTHRAARVASGGESAGAGGRQTTITSLFDRFNAQPQMPPHHTPRPSSTSRLDTIVPKHTSYLDPPMSPLGDEDPEVALAIKKSLESYQDEVQRRSASASWPRTVERGFGKTRRDAHRRRIEDDVIPVVDVDALSPPLNNNRSSNVSTSKPNLTSTKRKLLSPSPGRSLPNPNRNRLVSALSLLNTRTAANTKSKPASPATPADASLVPILPTPPTKRRRVGVVASTGSRKSSPERPSTPRNDTAWLFGTADCTPPLPRSAKKPARRSSPVTVPVKVSSAQKVPVASVKNSSMSSLDTSDLSVPVSIKPVTSIPRPVPSKVSGTASAAAASGGRRSLAISPPFPHLTNPALVLSDPLAGSDSASDDEFFDHSRRNSSGLGRSSSIRRRPVAFVDPKPLPPPPANPNPLPLPMPLDTLDGLDCGWDLYDEPLPPARPIAAGSKPKGLGGIGKGHAKDPPRDLDLERALFPETHAASPAPARFPSSPPVEPFDFDVDADDEQYRDLPVDQDFPAEPASPRNFDPDPDLDLDFPINPDVGVGSYSDTDYPPDTSWFDETVDEPRGGLYARNDYGDLIASGAASAGRNTRAGADEEPMSPLKGFVDLHKIKREGGATYERFRNYFEDPPPRRPTTRKTDRPSQKSKSTTRRSSGGGGGRWFRGKQGRGSWSRMSSTGKDGGGKRAAASSTRRTSAGGNSSVSPSNGPLRAMPDRFPDDPTESFQTAAGNAVVGAAKKKAGSARRLQNNYYAGDPGFDEEWIGDRFGEVGWGGAIGM
ncbi:hypothetical protein M427DRAFT_458413 [Gonapodya prolifera JEL478]|uniref:Uncharacterized protein n=1 Tax=Gonapodya prolifera (strain JEL478) TaxID=1344416 RepID=A0A139A383_GONPJ|nr:hypothetical protein M427DRAFT_458413 [Gonapodya prolifera JEL478]|eukprot:KXS10843.1 hypothetical protein M427DRAFT_458413 [Gonapodya prolifera JEL478]